MASNPPSDLSGLSDLLYRRPPALAAACMLTRQTYTYTPQAEAAIRAGKKDLRACLLAPAGEVEEGVLRPAVRLAGR